MKFKKLMASILAVTAVASCFSTTVFAYPKTPDDYYGLMIPNFNGTWKCMVDHNHPTMPAPSDWAKDTIYYAAARGLFYAPDYNRATGTMGPGYISWQAPMTRDNFGDTLVTIYNEIMAKAVDICIKKNVDMSERNFLLSHTTKNWLVNEKFDTSIYKISEAEICMYNSVQQNPNESFDERFEREQAFYNKYVENGGKLDIVNWGKFIFGFDPTFDPGYYKRVANFTDMSSTTVETLCASGWMKGVTETQFKPYDVMTREDAAQVVYDVLTSLGIPATKSTTVFADDNQISADAKEAVYMIMGLKDDAGNPLMPNISNNTFKPQAQLTTEEGTVLLIRMLDTILAYMDKNLK